MANGEEKRPEGASIVDTRRADTCPEQIEKDNRAREQKQPEEEKRHRGD